VLLINHRKLFKHPFNRLNNTYLLSLNHNKPNNLGSHAIKQEGKLAVRVVEFLYKPPLLLLKLLNVLLEIYVSAMPKLVLAIPPAVVQGNEPVVADNNNLSNRSKFPRQISISRV